MTAPFHLEDQADSDLAAVEALLDSSFGIGRRTKTSYRLREGSSPIPGLSMLVRDAELGLSGTISFWPLCIGKAGTPALLLGPLAVHPQRQNLGIGLTLMREGLDAGEGAGPQPRASGGRRALLRQGRLPQASARSPDASRPLRSRPLSLSANSFLARFRAPPAWCCRPTAMLRPQRPSRYHMAARPSKQSAQGKQGGKERDVGHGRHAIGPVVAKADPACACRRAGQRPPSPAAARHLPAISPTRPSRRRRASGSAGSRRCRSSPGRRRCRRRPRRRACRRPGGASRAR